MPDRDQWLAQATGGDARSQWLTQATAPTPLENTIGQHFDSTIQAGAGKLVDEDAIYHHAHDAAADLKTQIQKQFPGGEAAFDQDGYEDKLRQSLYGQLLREHTNQWLGYYNSGAFGRRATPEDVGSKIPGVGIGLEISHSANLKGAAAAIGTGQGTEDAYRTLGQHMARSLYDSQAGYGQKTWDIASVLPRMMIEWEAATPFAKGAGSAAEAGAAKLGLGAFGAHAARLSANVLMRTGLNGQQIAGEMMANQADKIGFDQYGRITKNPGEEMPKALYDASVSQFAQNAAMEIAGTFQPKSGIGVMAIGKSAAKAYLAPQIAQEATYYAQASDRPGVFTQLASAKTDEERRQILTNEAASLTVFTGLESALHVLGPKAAKEAVDKAMTDGQAAGHAPETVANSIASMIDKHHLPPEAPQQGGGQPFDHLDPDSVKGLAQQYLKPEDAAGVNNAKDLRSKLTDLGYTPETQDLLSEHSKTMPGHNLPAWSAEARASGQPVGTPVEMAPESPRQEAQRLEAMHYDAMRRLVGAQARERQAKNDQAMGLTGAAERLEAATNDRKQAERDKESTRQRLVDARDRATIEESKKRPASGAYGLTPEQEQIYREKMAANPDLDHTDALQLARDAKPAKMADLHKSPETADLFSRTERPAEGEIEAPGAKSEAAAGEMTPWHREYLAKRQAGMGHSNAKVFADLAHDPGQSWVHSGTEFYGPDKNTFKDSKGDEWTIGRKDYEDGGVRLGIPDSGGETAHVVLVKNPDGSYHGEMLGSDVPGHARAMYDYASEKGLRLVPSKGKPGWGLGQSPEGAKFWQGNAEKAGQRTPQYQGNAPAKPTEPPPATHPLAPEIRKALRSPDIATSLDLKNEIQMRTGKKTLNTEVLKALDEMVRSGEVEHHVPEETDFKDTDMYILKEFTKLTPEEEAAVTNKDVSALARMVEQERKAANEKLQASANDAQRRGLDPASIRRAIDRGVQAHTPAVQAANAAEGTPGQPGQPEGAGGAERPPTQAGAGPAPAPAGAAAAGRVLGHPTTIVTPDGGSVPARYEVRELKDVTASHTLLPGGAFKDNAKAGDYPKELQPRDYDNDAERAKVFRLASKLDPRYYISSHPDATSGPPSISEDGTVLNGNGRHMALQRYAQLARFPAYKAELMKQAAAFGLDTDAIARMDRPALYRVVGMDPKSDEAFRFARQGNVSPTQAQDVTGTAQALSHLIPSDVQKVMHLEPDTTFAEGVNRPSGREFRKMLQDEMRKQAPSMESDLFETNGELTAKGKDFVRQMLLSKVMPGGLIKALGERRAGLLNGIENAIPQLLLFQRQGGESDVTPQLREALGIFSRNPDLKGAADVDLLLSQGSLFGGRAEPITPGGKMLLDFLVENRDKPVRLRAGLVDLAQALDGGNGLFASEQPPTSTLAAQALGVKELPDASFGEMPHKTSEKETRDAILAGAQEGIPAEQVQRDLAAVEAEALNENQGQQAQAPQPGGSPAPGAAATGPAPGQQPGRPARPEQQLEARRQAEEASGNKDAKSIMDAIKGEEAFYDPMLLWDRVSGTIRQVRDGLAKMAGNMFPAATRFDRETGELMARFVASPTFSRELATALIDRVVGPNATLEDRLLAGAVITERRLRHMRNLFASQGDIGKANAVTSIVGADGSPLKTNADYLAALSSPRMQEVLKAWKQHVVPYMDSNFRRYKGLEVTDPIDAPTQIPGEPVNLKPMRADDPQTPGVVYPGGRGSLKGLKATRLRFAEEASGSAAGYDIDLAHILENSMMHGTTAAAKAEMYRTMVANGSATWGVPGARLQGATEFPQVRPPAGTQEATAGQTSLYVHDDVAPDFRQAIAVDQPNRWPILRQASDVFTKASLLSTVEAATHLSNQATMMLRPGMSPADFIKNAYGVIRGDAETTNRLLELARIGALKDPGMETGMLWGGKTDPTVWTSKLLDVVSRSMRLTADQAFDRLAARGEWGAKDTETNRRDFINQLGQYNAKAQNKLVAFLRDTGLGPFATASTNYHMQGLRSLAMDPGVEAQSWKGAMALRAEMLVRSTAVLATVPILNYLLWRRLDGDDNTPLGAVKVGTTAKGKTSYIDVGSLTGITRGARLTGVQALAEGQRAGAPENKTEDKAVQQIADSLMEPGMGPLPRFAQTALTGKNVYGVPIAAKPPPGEPEWWQNLKAAAHEANPIASVALPALRPEREMTWQEAAMKAAGRFGVKERGRPPGQPAPEFRQVPVRPSKAPYTPPVRPKKPVAQP